MAVELISTTQRYQGRTSDTKPVAQADGSALRFGAEFYEIDSGKTYVWDGSVWTVKQLPGSVDSPPPMEVATDVALDRIATTLELLSAQLDRLTWLIAAGFDLDVPDLDEVA